MYMPKLLVTSSGFQNIYRNILAFQYKIKDVK